MAPDLEHPELATRTTIELAPRLTRSLGRCYPDRRLIRIAPFVAHAKNGNGDGHPLLREVLCHKLAHLAAHELHAHASTFVGGYGGTGPPHDEQWNRHVTRHDVLSSNSTTQPR